MIRPAMFATIILLLAASSSPTRAADAEKDRLAIAADRPRLVWWYDEDADESEVRMLLLRMSISNPGSSRVEIPLSAWKLTADGREQTPVGELNEDMRDAIERDGEKPTVEQLKLAPLTLEPGKSAETWLVFPRLPDGNLTPRLLLECHPEPGAVWKLDLNADFAARLGQSVERTGPSGLLVLIHVSGDLNVISAGTLAEAVDQLAAQQVSRVIVNISSEAPRPDPSVKSWLRQVAGQSGYGEFYNDEFPAIPASVSEFHLVLPPRRSVETVEDPSELALRKARRRARPAGSGPRNVHRRLEKAISAAMQTLCESLPRETLLAELRSGDVRTRPAILRHGGERLLAGDLPLVLELTAAEDPSVRRAAVLTLRHFSEPAAIRALEAAVVSADTKMASSAVTALANSRFDTAHRSLVRLLGEHARKADVRQRIVSAMARSPRAAWIDSLTGTVLNSEGELAVTALRGLAAVDGTRAAELAPGCLDRSDPLIRAAALELLMEQADADTQRVVTARVLDALRREPPSPAMCAWLVRTGLRAAVPLLRHWVEQADAERPGVVETLLQLGDLDTIHELNARFDSLQPGEQRHLLLTAAALDLPEFWIRADQVLAGGNSGLTGFVAAILSRHVTPRSERALILGLSGSHDPDTLRHITSALAELGTHDARKALFNASRTASEPARSVAQESLKSLWESSPGMYHVNSARTETTPALAIAHLNAAVEVDPDLPAARHLRGMWVLRIPNAEQAQLETARDDYTRLIELSPEISEGYTGLGLIQVRLGQWSEGVQASEDVREKFLKEPVYLYNMACIRGLAIEALEKAAADDAEGRNPERIRQLEDQALADLRASLTIGLDEHNREWMKQDPDLVTIRRRPEFNSLFEQIPGSEQESAEGTPPAGQR